MPIYEYRCTSCGVQNEHLQKISAAPLSTCPECGQETYTKLVSAAGFQLKGTGWYVTDFRDNGSPAKARQSGSDTSSTASADSGAGQTGS